MMHAEKCPVCEGSGKYKDKKCHGCSGCGWVAVAGMPMFPLIPTPYSPCGDGTYVINKKDHDKFVEGK